MMSPARLLKRRSVAHKRFGAAAYWLWVLMSLGPCRAAVADDESVLAVSQPPYLAVSSTSVPNASFESPPSGSEIETAEFRVSAGIFRFGDESANVDLGLDYQYTRYQYDGINGRNRDLHWLQLPVGFATPAGRWQISGFVAPGVFTSSNVFQDLFDEGSSDDFSVTGRLEALSAMKNSMQWLAGVAYDRSFGEPNVFPVAGVVYRPNDDLRLRIAFPDSEIRYRATPRQAWTGRVFPAGSEWHVVSDELGTDFDYSAEAWRAQAWWSYRLSLKLSLDLSLGYEFGRHVDFIDDTGARINADVDDQFFFAFGLRFGRAPIPYGQQLNP